MGLLEDKKTAAALIMRKMRGSEDYDSMKSSNEEMKQVPTKDGAEVENYSGCMLAAEEMMQAVESKDVPKFKRALDAYLEMKNYEQED